MNACWDSNVISRSLRAFAGLGGDCIVFLLVSVTRMLLSFFGLRDAARHTVPVSYSLPRLVIAVALAVVGGWLTCGIKQQAYHIWAYYEIRGVGRIEILLVVGSVLVLPALAVTAIWALRIRALLRVTRFANS